MAAKLLSPLAEAILFVVPRTTPTSTETRTATPQSQRGSETLAFPNPISADPPASAKAAAVAPPASQAANGMQKLLDAMKSLGMNPATVNMSYSEDVVGYPGGSYVNRMINVTSGGRTEQFSAELTEKNPFVTAYEMQRYLGVPAAKDGTNGVKYS